MPQDTAIYLTNIIIGAILAALLTDHWRKPGRSACMVYWMLAAWVMTAADILFAARPELPLWIGRVLPTLMVTAGQGILLLGARKSAELSAHPRAVAALTFAHGIGLVWFLVEGSGSNWRMVMNGVLWAGLSFVSYRSLRRGPEVFWRPLAAPANAFLCHGVFHGLRVSCAILFEVQAWPVASGWLQVVGDLEVSFFMVALFVSLLVAHLRQRNEELSRALAEVQTLTGLLPICAWCRKVRNDSGYWQQLEDYFVSHSRVQFTHGICVDCSREQFPKRPVPTVK